MENIITNENIETVETEQEACVTPEQEVRPPRPAYDANLPKMLGRMIDEDNDLVTAEMPSDVRNAELDEITRAIKQHRVLYCKVIAVESGEQNLVKVIGKYGTLRIVFEAPDFFYYSTMKDMDVESEENKARRYVRKASRMLGAAVSFVPLAVGHSDDQNIPFVIASRRASMAALQEAHFFAPNADAAPGMMAKASIVSVGPRYVTVECLGVETTLGTGALSATEFIADASRKYKVGDGLYVAIQEMEVDKEAKVINTIRLSHALLERLSSDVERVSESMRGNRYIATVVAVTPKYYVVVLDGLKLRGLVRLENNIGEDKLATGDKVSMLVTDVREDKNMVVGKCRKTT